MFKIIRTKNHQKLVERVANLSRLYDSQCLRIDELEELNRSLVGENTELKERAEKVETDGSSIVTLKFSEDATHVTPIIKYNPAVVEKLIEQGFLNDATAQDKFAVQITMMTIAADAIDQILESFSEDVREA